MIHLVTANVKTTAKNDGDATALPFSLGSVPEASPSDVITPRLGDKPQPKSFSLTMLHTHPSSQVIRLTDDKSVWIKVRALPSPFEVYMMVDLSTYSADMLIVC